MSKFLESYLSIYEGKDPSFQVKKSSGAGALTKDAAEQLGPKAVELRKKKAASVDLPKVKKEEVEVCEEKEEKSLRTSNPCWKGYHPIGTKKKNGKIVPNCVPKEESDYILDKVVSIIKEKKDDPCWDGYKQVGMKKKKGKEVPNCVPVKEAKDHEHSMARTELDIASKAIKSLKSKVKGEGNIEAWVQSKITRAADYLKAASDYMDSGEHHVEEEFVIEKEMSPAELKKEKQLKKKYDKSSMKQNMIDQYGKEKGTQIYFAKIRKMAMEETEQLDEIAPLVVGGLAAAGGLAAIHKARQAAKSGVDAAKSGVKVKPSTGIAGAAYGMQKRKDALNSAMQQLRQSFDYEEAYEYIIEALVDNEFVDDYESAENIFESISDVFVASILEEYLEEKARGTRKKTTVHAYDVDETLFGHGKKGKPNVKVHVNDASGKRVKSLSNQEFNTHKLEKGHKYDFSEFQSAKKFKETSSPNKKVIKDIKRKQARGQNVHLITARSKFDKPSEFQGHLKKHGVNVDKSKIHYTGGMKGGDVGEKKVKVANAVAKKSGGKKVHMYDDAAKVHKAFEKEKKNKPTSMGIKTHMVAPDKSGESRVRSFQATKGGSSGGPQKTTKEKQRARNKARKNMREEMTAYEFWKQFINED